MSDSENVMATSFEQLRLPAHILQALDAVGYETPSAIQAGAIPLLQDGRDLIGQAQTGTGKTAAFALPILAGIDLKSNAVQALILAPTRELAIQVAEAFQRYAIHMPGFHVLPIYGGQDYGIQLRALRRGAHVVVGTPGRVCDHMRRGTLSFPGLRTLVLDEADEMLRMGFIEDIEWVLSELPEERQIALFSATMPKPIRAIAKRYLNEPETVSIEARTATATTVRHRYSIVHNPQKLDALTRVLEAEPADGVLIFVRTRLASLELAERLTARGFACSAINGDMAQKLRERTIEQFREGTLDILIATDVAARGLDVERVSLVINFDIPYDPEAYVHRIGRTGRAGRSGDAILFVTPREMRMLRLIEQSTRQTIERVELPSAAEVNLQREGRLFARIEAALGSDELGPFETLLTRFQAERQHDPMRVAAALARLLQGDEPLYLTDSFKGKSKGKDKGGPRYERERGERHHAERPPRSQDRGHDRSGPDMRSPGRWSSVRGGEAPQREQRPYREPRFEPKREPAYHGETERERPTPERRPRPGNWGRYRVEVGYDHGVKPGNLVGAITGESELEFGDIGHIDIREDHSIVELPKDLPPWVLIPLKRVWVARRQLQLRPESEGGFSPRQERQKAEGERPRKKERHRDRKNKGAPRARKRQAD